MTTSFTDEQTKFDPTLVQKIRDHIELKFLEAEIEASPFPHLIIENLFPEDVFKSILELNPFKKIDGEEWISQKKTQDPNRVTSTPYYLRKQINLGNRLQNLSSSKAQEFWNSIRACFISADHWFENLVINKYSTYFEIRFGDFLKSPVFFDDFKTEFFLQRHQQGYFIGPHTDVPTRVFTCIFSFADSCGYEKYGTQICIPKDSMNRCWGNGHHSWNDFKVVKIAPYKPNNFFLFFKTRQSFHAVNKIDQPIPNDRYGMQFQFYEPYRGIFNDLSAPDLMQPRHHKETYSQKEISKKEALKILLNGILR